MAKNSLDDLNNLLYQTLENLIDPDVDEKGNVINEVTPEKAKAIVSVANAIISSSSLQLEAIQIINEGDLSSQGNDKIRTKLLGE